MEKKIRTGDWKMVIEKSNTSQRGSRKSNIIISEEAKCGDWGMFWGTEAGGGGGGGFGWRFNGCIHHILDESSLH